jgi:hypothetical protein
LRMLVVLKSIGLAPRKIAMLQRAMLDGGRLNRYDSQTDKKQLQNTLWGQVGKLEYGPHIGYVSKLMLTSGNTIELQIYRRLSLFLEDT